jgi:DNA-binding transcriptional MerR regulator
MSDLEERRYGISEVSRITGVEKHVLRQWEDSFSQLRPKRTRTGRRYYLPQDIEIVKRIKYLLRHDHMRAKGASIRLSEEIRGEGRPRTGKEALDLIAKIESEILAMLGKLESTDEPILPRPDDQ